MPSLMSLGKQHIMAGLNDEACNGVTLVVPSPNVDRVALAAWAIHECVQAPTPGDEEFRAMYVAGPPALLDRMQQLVWRHKRGPHRLREAMYEVRGETLPALKEVNYATVNTVHRVTDRFPTDSLELLVLDERAGGEMDRLPPFVARANPLFTIVLTTHEPPENWPWHYLGTPLVLRGPSQTPKAEDAARPDPES